MILMRRTRQRLSGWGRRRSSSRTALRWEWRLRSRVLGLGEDGDARGVGGRDDGFRVEEKRACGFDGEAGGSGVAHCFDGADADDWDVEAHVLIWFGDFDYGEVAAEGGFSGGFIFAECAEESSGALDGGVGAFHGFDGDASLRRDDDSLAEVVGGDGAGDSSAISDVLTLVFIGGAAGEDTGFG